MAREFRLLPKAAADLAEGQIFYEEQSPGLGRYFRDTFNAELRSLLVSAGVHRKVHGSHRCLSKRFPYAIFYRVEGGVVAVYAVLDCRWDPADLRARLLGQ